MDIWMIWARDGGTAWLVDAWDEDTRDNNLDGWEAALAKARQHHGVDNVRVAVTAVYAVDVERLFAPKVATMRSSGVVREVQA